MAETLLDIKDLKTWFETGQGTVRAVDGVSFELTRGETFALLGESGCGKSMTALSIMQLVPGPAGRIVGGSVKLDGKDLLQLPEAEIRGVRGNRIAMIFQEPMTSLNPVLTVGEQINETLYRHRGLRGSPARAQVLELLEAVGIPDPIQRSDEYPHQLSGGMKQRVMIAMALAGQPELLIADEPTTALDVTIQAQILDLLRTLQKQTGMTILLITHDLGVVSEMANRIAVMYAGQIVEVSGREQFFAAPQHPYAQKLFDSVPNLGKRAQRLGIISGTVPSLSQTFSACRFAPRCPFAWTLCEEKDPKWIQLSPEQGVRCHLADPEEAATRPQVAPAPVPSGAVSREGPGPTEDEDHLQINDLKVYFPIHKGVLKRVVGYVRAVDGISLEIRRGQTLALVGESGCGKTTAAKGILQLVRPSAGSVRYRGVELTQLKGAALRPWRADLQIIFQDPYSSLNPRMRIADILEEGMVAQGIGQSEGERQGRIDELLKQVGLLPEIKRRYPHEFSGGQRQRISIARSLAVNPKLIICDEPTSALDLSVQAQILNLLKDLQNRLGLAYLFITHNLSVVEYLADEVAVMYLGRIVEYGTVQQVIRNPHHPYTRALLSAVPMIDPATRREVIRLEGDPPSPVRPPTGCHFHPRCPHTMPTCKERYPEDFKVEEEHSTRCFLYSPSEGYAPP